MKRVAEEALDFCTHRYGRRGLAIETSINSEISWQPTFWLKPNKSTIIAVEASEILYPNILKVAAHDLRKFDSPVSVILACPLEIYLADKRQAAVAQLENDGFGIITVSDEPRATFKSPCIPISQHISKKELEDLLKGLKPQLKVAFRNAHDTFRTDVGQGLQSAGQIVEAVVRALAKESEKAGYVSAATPRAPAADVIDTLYTLEDKPSHAKDFVQLRAGLAGARPFLRDYRNTASHPSATAKQLAEKIKKCRSGFIDAIHVSNQLLDVMAKKGFRLSVHLG